MTRGDDERFMRRAITLAMKGRGRVEPNPMVGCVIVNGGRVIGEGFHQRLGESHAEPNALASCSQDPRGATAYVTLEPCCHTNKRTPPCCPRLIDARLSRIVLGAIDPNPDVNGNGIAQLRAAGIDVSTGVLENQCNQLLAPFIAVTRYRRPYVTLKWAQTADGKVAGAGGARLQITSAESNRLVHLLRSRSDAILVGIGTVLADDPLLTARDVDESRLARRIVLDSRLRLPEDCALVRTAADVAVDVYTTTEGYRAASPARIRSLLNAGINIIVRDGDSLGFVPLPDVLSRCASDGFTHLMVEPGPTLASVLLAQNLVDRVWIFRSTMSVGDPAAPSPIELPEFYVRTGQVSVGPDTFTEYLNPRSDVYFTAEPSADFRHVGSAPRTR
jgi:diaminohydroxyphosphoribosylaminopyrimidine deaminase / 5-amino-6-(5-phosphoribosylamino)uracil reductase